jgi:hypothetical protein
MNSDADAAATLPPLYSPWLEELLAAPIPAEARATCDQCVMLADPGQDISHQQGFFNPQTKCCTYLPALPNFSVGGILRDEDPHPSAVHGRATVSERLASGVGVSPLGIDTSRAYSTLYRASGTDGFGLASSLLCPHYVADSGQCGVHKYRNSICCTWFCKFNRGAVGSDFWDQLRGLLAALEGELSWWCVRESALSSEARTEVLARFPTRGDGQLTAFELDRREDPTVQRQLWGDLVDRKTEYFAKCAECVDTLCWADLDAIISPRTALLAETLRKQFQLLQTPHLPERLQLGPIQVTRSGSGKLRLRGYRDLDPLEVSETLFHILPSFDGRPRDLVAAELEAERGVRLTLPLLQKLADFQILLPGED